MSSAQVAELLQAGHAVQPGGAARGAGAPLGAQGRRALAVGLAAGGGEDLGPSSVSTPVHIYIVSC